MILSSKQALIISASQNKEFFMFDPKTTAVLHKYRDQVTLMPHITYHAHSQQLIAQQNHKTFVSVWNWDSQEPEIKISLTQTMTIFSITPDGHFLIGGSITGNLYYWELPTGILIKKKSLHPTAIIAILPFKQNHLITVSKSEIKIWSLYSLLIEQDNSPSIKQFNSMLDIVGVAQARGVIAVLTNKNLTLLSPSLNSESRDMKIYQKIDYEFATALTVSNTSVFVGDGKGNIEIVELIQNQQEKTQLFFKAKGASLQISRAKKKKVLSGTKNPVSCLAFVQSLGYLIAGHTSGEVFVWSNQEIKKSLHLFKTTINSITVIPKPQERKIHQTSKIRPLHKYELSKEQEPLEIIPDYHQQEESMFKNIEDNLTAANQNELVLESMLQTLKRPQKLLREEISALRTERSKLLQANLHYFKLIVP